MADEKGFELGWDDSIEKDGTDFVVLPAGDYDFEVTQFERGRHAGSDKLPPCNKAIVHIYIETETGVTTIKHNLYLHSRTEGLLCAFFTAIGQRQHGENLKMNWNTVVGAKGRCRIGVRTYEGKEFNEIKKFYEPAEKKAAEPQKEFQAGDF